MEVRLAFKLPVGRGYMMERSWVEVLRNRALPLIDEGRFAAIRPLEVWLPGEIGPTCGGLRPQRRTWSR